MKFQDNHAILNNPDMGLILYEYTNQAEIYGSSLDYGDTLAEFPGISTVYMRLPWGLLEPEEGCYDWSWFDTPAQRHLAMGRKVSLRVTTSESFMTYATPKWVFDLGIAHNTFKERFKNHREDRPGLEPDFGDPVYLQKLDRFMEAFARRYDGAPNVDSIDIGTLGMWGEGHTYHGTGIHVNESVIRAHLELHTRHFEKTRLIVNDNILDLDYGSPELVQYCQQHDMGLRNDSICALGKGAQGTPYREVTEHLCKTFWLTAPIIAETTHYGQAKLANKWQNQHVLDFIQNLHASYLSLHWWPRKLFAEEPELLARAQRLMGYRLMPLEAHWPKDIHAGESWNFEAKWCNTGVAPMYRDRFAAITLKDCHGGIAMVKVDENTNLRRVLPATMGKSSPGRYEQNYTIHQASTRPRKSMDPVADFGLSSEILKDCGSRSATLKPGSYELFLSVGSRQGTPEIELPLDGHDGDKRYHLGQINLKAE